MMRLALGKGRNLPVAVEALRAAGLGLEELENGERRLRLVCPEDHLEILLLKDWDLPLYVEYGIADFGIAGSDVLGERGGDLLVPARLRKGGSRLSWIAKPGVAPKPGDQLRLVTKYPRTARQLIAERPWSAEILKLSGSVELGPLLDLADLALDIVQTGRTLRENGLVELEVVQEVMPCLIANRGAYLQHRQRLNEIVGRLEKAEVVR